MIKTTKKCTNCNLVKNISEFSRYNKTKQWYKTKCKLCINKNKIKYRRTKKGLIDRIYFNQKVHSKRRGHVMPTYSFDEFKQWINNHKNFTKLFNSWVFAEFDKNLIPSVDRVNDYLPYSINNITLTVWSKNNNRGNEDIKNGINNKMSKAIIQKTINNIFISEYYSMMEAYRVTGICNKSISSCCIGNSVTAGGFKWEYA